MLAGPASISCQPFIILLEVVEMVERRTKRSRFPCTLIIVMGCSFLCGSILGSAFAAGLSEIQTDEIRTYLQDYISLAHSSILPKSFASALRHHCFWLLLCVLAGSSVLGIIFLPFLFTVRGFLLVFMTGCFVRIFGGRGIVPAVLISGLSACAWLPGMLIVSLRVLKPIPSRMTPKTADHSSITSPGFVAHKGFVIAFLLICICVLLECTLIPALLPVVSRIIVFREGGVV